MSSKLSLFTTLFLILGPIYQKVRHLLGARPPEIKIYRRGNIQLRRQSQSVRVFFGCVWPNKKASRTSIPISIY